MRQDVCIFGTEFTMAMCSPGLLSGGKQGLLPRGGHRTENPFPPGDVVKNAWRLYRTFPYVFMACLSTLVLFVSVANLDKEILTAFLSFQF